MKKTIITFTILALAGQMWGRSLTPAEALSRALGDAATPAKVSAMGGVAKSAVTPAYTLTDQTSGNPTLYVITPSDGKGFVIVSADDAAAPLLGYSDSGTFDPNNMPDNLRWWLGQYDEAITFAMNSGNNIDAVYAASPDRSAIAPMITTKWNQDEPYSDDCPVISGSVAPTGCVATAMAQILNYHKWPEQGVGSNSYTWNGKTLSFDFANTTFRWDSMLDVYDSSATPEQKAAVAELMYACGISVNMQYNVNMSGAVTTNVAPALREYFNYDKGMYTALRYNYTAADWEELVYNELAAGRPLYYAGQSVEGGHAFVCDGYSQGYFHFNWGWGGMSDGYFLLTALDPASQGIGGYSSGFNQRHTIITGIQKPQEGSSRPAPNLCLMNFINTYLDGTSLNVTGPFYNYSTYELASLKFRLQLVNDETGATSNIDCKTSVKMGLSTYTTLFNVSVANIPEGSYTATVGFVYSMKFYPVNPLMGDTGKLKIVSNGTTAEVTPIRSGDISFSNVRTISPFYVGKVFGMKADYTYEGSEPLYTKIIPILWDSSNTQLAQGTELDIEIAPGSGTIEYVGEFTTSVPAGSYYITLNRSDGTDKTATNLLMVPVSQLIPITISTLSWTRNAIVTCADTDWEISDADNVDPTNLTITASPQVTLGYYASPIIAAIFSESETNLTLANAIATIYSENLFIDQNETKTTTIKGDFVAAEAGKTYQVMLYQASGTRISTNAKTFTVSGNTAITDIETDSSSAPAEYFNLQGQRVENPVPGLYIRRQGDKAEKVYIR